MLKTRILTALVLGLGLFAAIMWLPNFAWALFCAAIVMLAAHEWCGLVNVSGVGKLVFQVGAGLPATFFAVADGLVASYVPLIVFAVGLAFWVVAVPVFLSSGTRIAGGAKAYLIGWLMLIPPSLAMITLREAGIGLLIASMGVVWIADTAAYFVGRAIGRRKLAPKISPGKSWEGVFGAVFAVFIYMLILHAATTVFAMGVGVLLGGFIAVGYTALSVVGDLFESLAKRQAGMKDSGSLLPGHGGILDRVDSLLSTLPLAGLLYAAYQFYSVT